MAAWIEALTRSVWNKLRALKRRMRKPPGKATAPAARKESWKDAWVRRQGRDHKSARAGIHRADIRS